MNRRVSLVTYTAIFTIDHANLTKTVTLLLLGVKSCQTGPTKYKFITDFFFQLNLKYVFILITEPCRGIDADIAVSLVGNSEPANTQYG